MQTAIPEVVIPRRAAAAALALAGEVEASKFERLGEAQRLLGPVLEV